MPNCEHEGAGICKSCKQTLREGGAVDFQEEEEPKPKRKAPAKK